MSAKGSADSSPYQIDVPSIKFKNGVLEASVIKQVSRKESVKLPLSISFLESGAARVTIDEEKREKGDIELRHGSKARKERYNEAGAWVLTGAGLRSDKNATPLKVGKESTQITWGAANEFKAFIKHSPFGVDFYRGDVKEIVLNERGFMNMEHWRPHVEKPKADENDTTTKPDEEDESTWWDETFGGNTDSKPRGPESVALDISFPGFEHVYGISEHTGPLSLRQTRGGDDNFKDPYRMFNSDVFEYELNSPMTLYGAIPFMQAHKKGSTVGVFWLNAAETWVDIVKKLHSTNPLALGLGSGITDTQTHWISEAGQMDLFIMLGPKPEDVIKTYTQLTGYTQLPAEFALGHHQCRWNYISDEDVKDVDRKFDKSKIPYDVIWLDIEYTDGKAYFTWDSHNFPDPIAMEKQLDANDRKLVVIIDPHIKNRGDYFVVDELKSKDLAIKNKEGNIFEGWCWPGSSHWIDSFNPAARAWWKSLFTFDRFKGTMNNVWLWNDMNEPSVFNGPEITMPHDNLHHGNWEHRDLHNIYGMTYHNATYHALTERQKGEVLRPFVLTRSFFAGSQRLGPMWTGDNQASWEHLAASIPMVLNQGLTGYPFAGADVGGFFGNPSKELQTRWYQAGAFYPFFRAHAHIDTRRREPYLLGEPYTSIMAQAIRLRYSLLPSWYTAFHESHTSGSPVVKTMWYVHPDDEKTFHLEDQFYLGSTGLLVKPITAEGAVSTDIYLSDSNKYFDYADYTVYAGAGKSHSISAPLTKTPILMRAGHIFTRKDRPRRSSGLMKWDPYTLIVVLDTKSSAEGAAHAEGTLYVDDGATFDYEAGAYIHRQFTFSSSSTSSTDSPSFTLSSTDLMPPQNQGKKTKSYLSSMKEVCVEKIIVVDAPSSWQGKSEVEVTVSTEDGKKEVVEKAGIVYHVAREGKAAWAVVRRPREVCVGVGVDWSIRF